MKVITCVVERQQQTALPPKGHAFYPNALLIPVKNCFVTSRHFKYKYERLKKLTLYKK